MKILTVIPARGGSKRLPKKNILNLCGKPLIQWTIDEAKKCKNIQTIMVSTDNLEIADLSRLCNVLVPYLRPKHLATDVASTVDVVLDAILFYEKQQINFDAILLLQPTSPLRKAEHIKAAIDLYKNKKAKAVVSTTKCEHSPLWSNTLPDSLKMDNFLKEEIKGNRSQDLPNYYRLNGAIYIVDKETFVREKTFFPQDTYSLVMEQKHSIDIDSKLDFLVAETIILNEL